MANNERVAMVEKYGEIVAEAGRIAVELLAIKAAVPEGTAPTYEVLARQKAMWAAVEQLGKSVAAIPEDDRGPLQGELDTLYLTDSFVDDVDGEERNIGGRVISYLSGERRLELLRAAKKLGRTSGHPIDRLNQDNVEAVLRAALRKFRKPVAAAEKEQASGEATSFLARLKQRLTDSASKAQASKTRTWDRQSFETLLGWFERKNAAVGAVLRKEFEATAAPKPKGGQGQQGKALAKPEPKPDPKAGLEAKIVAAEVEEAKAVAEKRYADAGAASEKVAKLREELAALTAPKPDRKADLNAAIAEAEAQEAKAVSEKRYADAAIAAQQAQQFRGELAKLTPAAPAAEVKPTTKTAVEPAATSVAATTPNAPATSTPAPAGNGRTRSIEILTVVEGLTDERVGEIYAAVKNLADGGQEMARSIVAAHEVAKRYDRPKAVARAVELGLVSLS